MDGTELPCILRSQFCHARKNFARRSVNGRCGLSNSLPSTFTPTTINMAATSGGVDHWGEIDSPMPKTPGLHIEITEPKPAEYEVPRLHQPSSEHFPPKDE